MARGAPATDRTRYVAPRTRVVQSRVVYTNTSRRVGGSAYGTYGNRTNARVIRSRAYVAPTVDYMDVDRDESISDAVYDGVEDRVVLVQPYDNSRRYAGSARGYTPGYAPGYAPGYNSDRSYGARRYYGDGYSRPQAYRSRIYTSYGYNYGHGYSRHGYGYGHGPSYGHGYGHNYGHGGYGHGGYGGDPAAAVGLALSRLAGIADEGFLAALLDEG